MSAPALCASPISQNHIPNEGAGRLSRDSKHQASRDSRDFYFDRITGAFDGEGVPPPAGPITELEKRWKSLAA